MEQITTSNSSTTTSTTSRPTLTHSSSSFSKSFIRKAKSLINLNNSNSRSSSTPSIPSASTSISVNLPLASPTLSPKDESVLTPNPIVTRPRARTNSSLKGLGGNMFNSLFSGTISRSPSTTSLASEFGTLEKTRGLSLSVPNRNRSGSQASLISTFLSPSPKSTPNTYTPPQSPSTSSRFLPSTSSSRDLAKVIRNNPPFVEESSEDYLERLTFSYPQSSLACILSTSGEAFFLNSLSIYLRRFNFIADAIDIALRKFLLQTSLPSESQHIDRVVQAFAIQYHCDNPGLAISSDTFYVLSFSLIMLSTDLFNPNNKNKMSKSSYVKNTTVEDSVNVEILEYLYDQISAGRFIFAEEDSLESIESISMSPSLSSTKNSNISSGNASSSLNVDVFSQIPLQNPYSFVGTSPFFDAGALHLNYVKSPILKLANSNAGRGTALKIVKVGLLSKKDDLTAVGKKNSSRKWKGYSVVLSGSQLLFFKSTTFASTLEEAIHAATIDENTLSLDPALESAFLPDAALSLNDSIALYDHTYTKYGMVFRLIGPTGEFLFQAKDEQELCSWITSINFAASFKSANIRMRNSDREEFETTSIRPTPSSSVLNLSLPEATEMESTVTNLLPSVSEEELHPSQLELSERKISISEFSSTFITRADALRTKLLEIELDIEKNKVLLGKGIRRAKNLAITTPYRSSTRENLLSVVPILKKDIRAIRYVLVKLVCYREVLSKDLIVEERNNSTRIRRPNWNKTSRSSTFHSESFSDQPRDSFDTSPSLTDDELFRLRSPPALMLRTVSDVNDLRYRTLPSPVNNYDHDFKSDNLVSSPVSVTASLPPQ